ncbi:hypothetical protein [Proteiniborus sp. MB09-C3]|uniref:hypothetical protein n=1 Tax=Proteiniborus sp. MB09-C3 TaxID=3050072 RepID=UPI002553FDD7|nr:hypothetical protein [Proteiniborus sp. MB09-C3]WIV10378.1 hypothetical protein QO263_09390 [Proteiniborus sp. MB09-C3]
METLTDLIWNEEELDNKVLGEPREPVLALDCPIWSGGCPVFTDPKCSNKK